MILAAALFTACFNEPRESGTMLMLTGDVMLGHGIDQILRHSVNPVVHESGVTRFGESRTLIDEGGVALVHGHSSHHRKWIEIYRGRLILYGAVRSGRSFRCFTSQCCRSGTLESMTLVPLRMERFRLNRATAEETQWLSKSGRKLCDR